jgi:hypothetical protein
VDRSCLKNYYKTALLQHGFTFKPDNNVLHRKLFYSFSFACSFVFGFSIACLETAKAGLEYLFQQAQTN